MLCHRAGNLWLEDQVAKMDAPASGCLHDPIAALALGFIQSLIGCVD